MTETQLGCCINYRNYIYFNNYISFNICTYIYIHVGSPFPFSYFPCALFLTKSWCDV